MVLAAVPYVYKHTTGEHKMNVSSSTSCAIAPMQVAGGQVRCVAAVTYCCMLWADCCCTNCLHPKLAHWW